MEDLEIRSARASDLPEIAELSARIWNGEDYLARKAPEWLEDGHFYVAVYRGRLAGTAKVTILPGRLAWLEGLRVDPDLRGRGIAKALTKHCVGVATGLRRKGEVDAVEFATFFRNQASIHISTQAGFHLAERFYMLWCPASEDGPPVEVPRGEVVQIRAQEEGEVEEALAFRWPGRIPTGWKFLPPAPEALQWLRQSLSFFRLARGVFAVREGTVARITPVARPQPGALEALGSLAVLLRERGASRSSLVLHESWSDLIEPCLKAGFGFWEETPEPNVLVFELPR